MSKLIHEHHGGISKIFMEGQFVGGPETDTLQDLIRNDLPEGIKTVIFDLQKTTYMNSMMLGVLIGANANLKRKGIKLLLENVPTNILDILKMTKLDRLLNLS